MASKMKDRKVSTLQMLDFYATVFGDVDASLRCMAAKYENLAMLASFLICIHFLQKTPVSHKVIEKRRRDRINRCLNELGKTVPMALAKQVRNQVLLLSFQSPNVFVQLLLTGSTRLILTTSGKLEKAEILEMTVQYLRALHSADFPRGREKGELLTEFANYFHYGYHECMKNLVHYLTTVERMETKDTKYARILAFLQSKVVTEPVFGSLGNISPDATDYLCQLHSSSEYQSPSPTESVFQHSSPGHFSWHSSARSPTLAYPAVSLSASTQQHAGYLSPAQGLDHHYINFIGHSHANAFSLHTAQHAAL
uniref:Helt bHLH transcription factor n=1 Tax=Electrophorus electricus TaxID=8005 RepID=A0A4W4DUP8_ELEEL